MSIIPANVADTRNISKIVLKAANGTSIPTYGERLLRLNFGRNRTYQWLFTVAKVNRPIIGTDFLSHHNLLVDVRRKRLLDGKTHASIHGTEGTISTLEVPSLQLPAPFDTFQTEFPDIFRSSSLKQRAKHDVEHYIETKGPPITARARRLAPEKLKATKQEFEFMLKNGLCRPSKSPWASPLHMVPKKNGDWRPCGDYRRLNDVTEPDKYSIPFLQDCVQFLHGATILTTIDLVRAYQQIPVREADIPKTAIITPFGLYEFPYMTFGLRNAAQTFQRFMDGLTRDLDFCQVYLDDILIASRNLEEHLKHLRELFRRLDNAGVVINAKKCVFGVSDVTFLGHRISKDGLAPQEKVRAIIDYKEPTDEKGLRRFLGMINFYNRFIPNVALIQAPLHDAITSNKKNSNVTIQWNDQRRAAFAELKDRLAKVTLLAYPSIDSEWSIQTDASNYAFGAVLQQKTNGCWQPFGFFSRKMSVAQTKYSTYDKELLAIYAAVKHFHYMIEGRKFHILTDHKPLTYVFQQRAERVSPRQSRQISLISEFTTDIRYVQGTENVVPDALSRVDAIGMPVVVTTLELAEEQKKDTGLQNELQTQNSSLKLQRFYIPEHNVMLVCDCSTDVVRPYVPTTLRRKIFDMVHGNSHPSGKATRQQIAKKFVWRNMNTDITKWAKECLACQRAKISRHNNPRPLKLPMPDARFDHVHLDIVGPMPPSRGYRYCLTLIDRFSRWLEAVPIKDITAETIVRAFFDTWIARYGSPACITTDRGSQFEGQIFSALTDMLGTKRIRTTAYHPESNGLIERWHRSLKSAIMCQERNEWVDALPAVLLGLRTSYKEDINASTAEILFGKTLRLPGEFFIEEKPPRDPRMFVEPLRELLRSIRPVPTAHHNNRKPFLFRDLYNCTHVFVRVDSTRRPLDPPYTGPHRVVQRISDQVFKVNIDGKDATISVNRLKPAYMAYQPETTPMNTNVVPDSTRPPDVTQPSTSTGTARPQQRTLQSSTPAFSRPPPVRTYQGPAVIAKRTS